MSKDFKINIHTDKEGNIAKFSILEKGYNELGEPSYMLKNNFIRDNSGDKKAEFTDLGGMTINGLANQRLDAEKVFDKITETLRSDNLVEISINGERFEDIKIFEAKQRLEDIIERSFGRYAEQKISLNFGDIKVEDKAPNAPDAKKPLIVLKQLTDPSGEAQPATEITQEKVNASFKLAKEPTGWELN